MVLDFLYGSWSLVIASAQLPQTDKTDSDPAGYRVAVGTLLWSVRPEILRQPKQVFQALPGLLRTLNAGLAMLGKPAEETQGFFDALMRLHQPLLNLRRTRVQSDAAHSGPASLAPIEGDLLEPIKRVVGNGVRPVPAEQPWLTAQELAGAGFDDTMALSEERVEEGVKERVEAPAEPVSVEEPLPQAHESELADGLVAAAIGQLRQGVRVDLFSKGVWIRAELVWASNRSTLFMFTSHGGRVHSMTLRSCEKLVRKRWLRLVTTRVVVEAALRAVGEETANPVPMVEV